MARHLFPLSAIVNRTLHPSCLTKENSNLWICAKVQFVHLTAKQTSRAEHGTQCLTSGCHGNALSGFIPLLISQHLRVWQGRVMSFFDFYLLQPHKHRLTLISVLNASPCKVSESGPSFFFSFPLPPVARLLSSSSLSRQPAARRLSRRTQRLDKLMASRGWAAPFCAHHRQNLRKKCFTSKLLLSFDDVLKNVHRSGI